MTDLFLIKRMKSPNKDDWRKLKRLLKYLKGTRHMKLILRVNRITVIKWWIDASYLAPGIVKVIWEL